MSNDIVNFQFDKKPGSIIKVIGVGGGGGNAVNHMYKLGIRDVDFVICNTDSQALTNSPIPSRVHLGSSLTEGRGAGNKPEIGRQAATENIQDVRKALETNTKMVFITAGMGGGTGTGGAPVIAKLSRELGYLTIGIVTIPFRNEGKRRINQAIEGIQEMEQYVDSLLVINNERIREMYGDFPISQAFAKADDVLATAAKGIAEIITVPGYINVDFADVETVMRESGVAVMGTGLAEGEGRAIKAVEQALNSPLLNNNNIRGARNILLNVTSGDTEVTMDEIGEITDFIQNKAGFEADLIWGNGMDATLGSHISVTVIATGFSTSSIPEILSSKKTEKQKFNLNAPSQEKQPAATKPDPQPYSKPASVNTNSPVDFSIKSPSPEKPAWEKLYAREPAPVEKESGEKKRMNVDYTRMSEDDVENLENIPAYIRKQMLANQQGNLKSSEYSGTTVSADPKKKISFRDNNPYLHKNID
jgi:cell division protein FtsZ